SAGLLSCGRQWCMNVPLRPSDRTARPANSATNRAKGKVQPTFGKPIGQRSLEQPVHQKKITLAETFHINV
ncbi:MAG: hypothetical protein ABFC77_13315, partial [Thermoguttaceae bacterium]